MDGVDPDTLLEWLQTGAGEERDLQLMALEQLCMLLLMSDNIDRCFESCPPRTFLPALCKIFLDETAPENCLEVTARAITYYLDVSNECTRRITQVDGAVKAICSRLAVAEMSDRTSKDLAEQCVKLLEHICQRETSAVYDAGGLQCVLHLIRQHGNHIHKDTMHSAMTVITRLCSKIEPTDANLQQCSADLGALLCTDDPKVSECALRCFAALTDRFIRKSLDPVDLATPSNLVEHLLNSLLPTSSGEGAEGEASEGSAVTIHTAKPASFISIVLSLISNLCRGSAKVTDQLIRSSKFIPALKSVLSSKDERCVVDSLRLSDLLVVLICEGRSALPKSASAFNGTETASSHGFDRAHRHLIDAIRQRDTDALIDAVENGTVDPNFTDDVGQTLLNWCSAFGTSDMVIYLCDKGADVNKGLRSSSLHYAACFGRSDIVKILLRYGANPDLRDEEGKTALDKARERNDEGHQQVVQILESPASYMTAPTTSIENRKSEPSSSANSISETIDEAVIRNVLQQLIPVFCNIFQSSLVSGVRRSALGLIRKCVNYISPNALRELLDEDQSKESDDEKAASGEIVRTNFIENFMGVLVSVLEQEDDVDGVEQVLLIIKALLTKDVDFWLEQLIRLGVFEKIEALAQKNDDISIEREIDGEITAQKPLTYSPANFEISSENTGIRNEAERSATSTPSVSLRSEADTTDTEGFSLQNSDVVERARMLNIPVQMEEDFFDTSTPPPTMEIAGQERKSTTPPLDSHQPSNELVEAATAVAQVLGVQIDDDTLSAGPSKREPTDDVWKINSGVNYKWKDWRLIRSRDSLFLWCDAVAVEFSDGSNGWLRFLMDGRLSTMYSSGSPESGADNAETRAEFLNKLQKAKSSVPSGSQAKTIFSTPHPTKKIQSGNWLIGSDSSEQLVIVNKEGNQQKLLIKEDLPGFIFESSKHNRHCFMAESTLGLDFVTGWAARGGGRRLQFKAEAQKQKVHDLAKDLWDNYLKQAKTKPRDALIELQNAAKFILDLLDSLHNEIDPTLLEKENSAKLLETLEYVRDSIINERLLSIFEISVSQIVPALLELLNEALKSTSGFVAHAFRKAFSEAKDLNCLIRKMVLVLESAEKFPQFLYDAPGGSPFGLQLLNRRLRFRLEQADPESPQQKQFINRTNRLMKSEPLTTVGHLKIFLLKMLVKRWFDHSRETFDFIKQAKEAKKSKAKLNFEYESDFDSNGIVWWIGTNGKTTEWTNPASVGVVNVVCSDGLKQPYGQPEDILSRDVNALNCHTTDSTDANFTIDLGVLVYPTSYSIRHARGYGRSALRNWLFQGSKDNRVWDLLQCHSNDQSLNEPGSSATWPIVLDQGQGPYRYFRIAQNGKNASGVTCYLSLSGFELYGTVVDAIEKPLPSLEATPTPIVKEKNFSIAHSLSAVKKTIKKNTSTSSKSSTSFSGAPSKALPTSKALPVPNRPPNAASVKAKKLQQNKDTLNPFGQNMTGTSPASAMAAEFDLYGQLPGGTENNKLAVGCSLRSLLSGMPSRSKALRYRRTNRLFGFNNTGSPSSASAVVEPASPLSTEATPTFAPPTNSSIKIGSRVGQGPDWAWGLQGAGGLGTIISGPDHGWVDVQWDDGTSNSYRVGYENKVDLEVKEDQPTKRTKEPNSPLTPTSSNDSKSFLSSKFANNPASMKPEAKAMANLSTAINTTMSQKSMSTTNLFDEKKPSNTSVASTNQAASAESLQHQTPSLENLLARSRVHDDRIPEVVGDDQSPISTPEPHAENMTPISVAASSIAGGSQPVLSFTHAKADETSATFFEQLSFAETQSVSSSSGTISEVQRARDEEKDPREGLVSTPREDLPSNDDITENSARNLANLSVSAPNLAPLVKRQRWSAGSTSNEQEMLFAEEAELLRPIDEDTPLELAQPVTANVVQEIDVEIEEEPSQNPSEDAKSGTVSNELSFTDYVDVNYMNQIMNSREFYGELVDVYSEMMRAAESGNANGPYTNTNERDLLTNYALLEELAMAENDMNEGSTQRPPALAPPESVSQPPRGVNVNNPGRRNLTNIGSNIRSRLGNYADVLRNMMQQVIESGGSLHGFDADDIEEEFFDEEMTDEGNEDECDDFMNSSASNSNNATVTTASVFQSQVESLANAAAALRRQFSNSSGSGTVSSTSATPGGLQVNSTTTAPNDAKLNWRQIVMGEGGRLLYEVRPDGSVGQSDRANTGGRNAKRAFRTWDDDFVLKRQFGALIPAFDPRPGRTNINQTQDVELPATDAELDPVASTSASKSSSSNLNHPSKVRLYLKGPNLANVKDAIVELEDDEASIFAYVQKLMYMTEWGQKADKTRRIWEPTYTIIYENPSLDDSRVVQTTLATSQHNECLAPGTLVRQTVDVINTLKHFAIQFQLDINPEVFVSTKITQKLTQELSDPLVVSARALPSWCDLLVYSYPCLFTIETRNIYLKATAFGTSRAIVWLQNRRDQIIEQTRSGGVPSSNLAGSRREDHYPEFRVGRIKHERIKVNRNNVFQDAIRVMKFHASRKSVLEIEYVGEEGTGLGPTLEFYALVAAEFQKKSLAIWLCDDSDEQQAKLEGIDMDLGEGKKPPGYYIRRSGGLFPAPLPPNSDECAKSAELFRILGIFLAKVLQDGRLVDIPLSHAFLKLLVSPQLVSSSSSEPKIEDVLTLSDLEQVHPVKGHFLGQLSNLVHRKRSIESDPNLDSSVKRRRIEALRLELGEHECSVEDLALTFVVNPSSSVFEYKEHELIPSGANIDVTIDNVDLYVEKCLDFYLNSGIRQQVAAFRQGFDFVFPLKSLTAFIPNEVQTLLSGDQRPEWTREDVLKYTEPKLGYTRDSPGFLNFVEVLVGMNTEERKAFLQFTTGCSSLPPGGLSNLHPHLTIVRKVDSGDGSYPSVNTCVHYLKLPEYSSAEILRERLLAATNEKGFHLN